LLTCFIDRPGKTAVPVTPVAADRLHSWLGGQSAPTVNWIKGTGFRATAGTVALIPGASGQVARAIIGIGGTGGTDHWTYAGLPKRLPPGRYRLDSDGTAPEGWEQLAALGWALGAYAFDRYKARKRKPALLAWPRGIDRKAVVRAAEATYLVRDLVNTPTADMGPAELAAAARKLARAHGGRVSVIAGDALIKRNYPAIHAVGRASASPPRLIDLRWGGRSGKRVTLVGKGVCFDSGGLDIKPASAMKLMKKDMGGAAHALGLAHMIMSAGLKLRLRVLIPAVENSIAGNAMRPMDVVPTRKGITVEIGHTDAEGRVVLADALAEADREGPDLILDFATLTGAARVALGPELPALFANDDALAEELMRHGAAEADPLWRLPLWPGYRKLIDGKTADLTNSADTPHAGAITAALFLQEFVSPATPWAHLDVFAWNAASRPGRPEGGEAMGLRAAFAMIAGRFG
jgi:leucyl aminopeptidase